VYSWEEGDRELLLFHFGYGFLLCGGIFLVQFIFILACWCTCSLSILFTIRVFDCPRIQEEGTLRHMMRKGRPEIGRDSRNLALSVLGILWS
jgi:hypothetical protein